MTMKIAVCDLGLGNLRSVERALLRASVDAAVPVTVEVTRDADKIRNADSVVVPGQGGFGVCATALEAGLGDAIREQIARGTPYLGICLGLQVLFASSTEAPGARGLGVLGGRVVRLPGGLDRDTGLALKIPHIGWNTVATKVARERGKSHLLPALATHFYFVHSYAVVPDDPQIVAARTEYGADFVSAIAHENIFACQFHPEKSQAAGLALLARFLSR